MRADGHLVLCIDDYGLRPGVDAAVLSLFERGLANAASCMTGVPRWPAAAAALRALEPFSVALGLHLDFTQAPFDAGLRSGLARFMVRAYLRRLPVERVRAEIRAQLDAFEDALGRAPDHVDGHQHVHQLPVVRDLLVQELARRGARPWLRSTAVPRGVPGIKPHLIEHTGHAGLRRLARRHGLDMSDGLLGVYDFRGGAQRYAMLLRRWLSAADGRDVLMCHAGLPDGQEEGDPHAQARLFEHAVLRRQLPAMLREFGLRLR